MKKSTEELELKSKEVIELKLPSQHQIGDEVFYGDSNVDRIPVIVTAVHFTESKVSYDIKLSTEGEIGLHNIPSEYLTKK